MGQPATAMANAREGGPPRLNHKSSGVTHAELQRHAAMGVHGRFALQGSNMCRAVGTAGVEWLPFYAVKSLPKNILCTRAM